MDFVGDLVSALKAELRTAGIAYDDADDAFRFLRKYVNLADRQIKLVARRVHVAPDVPSKLASAPASVVKAYREIHRKAESGEDLRPYQSKALKKFDAYDQMLYDWGMQHLHMETGRTHDPFFVDRSSSLLFGIFGQSDAYFIDVRPHSEDAVWAQQELMHIVKDNWPELIERYRLPYMTCSGVRGQASDTIKLRRAGANPILELDGACYISRGGGINIAGSNPRHVDAADEILWRVRALEETVRNETAKIIDEVKKQGQDVGDDIQFRFVHDWTYCRVAIEGTNIVVYVANYDSAKFNTDEDAQ